MKKLHGVRLAHHKNTENCASVPLPLPKLVRIPMSMHIGRVQMAIELLIVYMKKCQ